MLHSLVFLPQCLGCDVWLEASDQKQLCATCLSGLNFLKVPGWFPHLEKRWFGDVYSAVAYDGVVLNWIHQLKFGKKLHWVTPLVALCDPVPLRWERYDAIVYVPLHWRRQIVRGFNPAHLLADGISRRHNKPLAHLLGRNKFRAPQTKLTREERLHNAKGVFRIRSKREALAGKNLLLLDDVVTTGATVNECAKILKKAGAAVVDVLTLARTL